MVTPFNELEYDEQLLRLDQVAGAALAAFDLPNASAQLAGYTNNTVYRVQDGQEVYALRLHRPGLKPLSWIQSELMWLRALQGSGLRVPQPAADLYIGALEGAAEPIICDLLTWVTGRPAPEPDDLSLEQVRQVGAEMAHLHHHAQTYAPPVGFTRPVLDWEGLFGAESPFASAQEADVFTAEQRMVMDAVAERVRAFMPDGALHLIHGDMVLKNILFDENGQVGFIDFDDCAFGHIFYDLASFLWRALSTTTYPAIRAALWEGYTHVRPAYADQFEKLEPFVAARHVASCRWIAGNTGHPAIRGKAGEIIAGRVTQMKHFLQTGELWLGHA
ncbi:MAG: phosphotransferase [Anaerolineae bacterium]